MCTHFALGFAILDVQENILDLGDLLVIIPKYAIEVLFVLDLDSFEFYSSFRHRCHKSQRPVFFPFPR